ncbi:rRNA pseudouridine synthase [Candidatus Woesearchaeota archaeon]|nr:rRNA pseudouridine synthase [Candidatus Woesearchaeota archaeon]
MNDYQLTRINQYLALCGVASRRKSEDLIRSGRVTINGREAKLGQKVGEKDEVLLDGEKISKEHSVYIAFYKPKGVISSIVRERGLPCALDYIDVEERIFIAGRLDLDAEGLLVLTNDGLWATKIAHPKHETSKTYVVKLKNRLDRAPQKMFIDGRPVEIKAKKRTHYIWEITIHEGRKHIVKRIFEELNNKVLMLLRVRIGNITLKNLKRGEWRYLSSREVEI